MHPFMAGRRDITERHLCHELCNGPWGKILPVPVLAQLPGHEDTAEPVVPAGLCGVHEHAKGPREMGEDVTGAVMGALAYALP